MSNENELYGERESFVIGSLTINKKKREIMLIKKNGMYYSSCEICHNHSIVAKMKLKNSI